MSQHHQPDNYEPNARESAPDCRRQRRDRAIRQCFNRADVFRVIAYDEMLVTTSAMFLVLAW